VNSVAWDQPELPSKEVRAAFPAQTETIREIIVLQHADREGPGRDAARQQTSAFKLFPANWANRFPVISSGLPGSLYSTGRASG
jgi:hypothetical protein